MYAECFRPVLSACGKFWNLPCEIHRVNLWQCGPTLRPASANFSIWIRCPQAARKRFRCSAHWDCSIAQVRTIWDIPPFNLLGFLQYPIRFLNMALDRQTDARPAPEKIEPFSVLRLGLYRAHS